MKICLELLLNNDEVIFMEERDVGDGHTIAALESILWLNAKQITDAMFRYLSNQEENNAV